MAALLYALLSFSHNSNRRHKDDDSIPYTGPRLVLMEEGELAFWPLYAATEFCRRRRWEVYSTRNRRRQVYNLFLINAELNWAYIRFN